MAVDAVVGVQGQRAPRRSDHAARRIREIGLALPLELPQERQRLEDRAAGRGPLERTVRSSVGRKLAHLAVAAQQVLVVVVLGRARQVGHRGDGQLELVFAARRGEHRLAQLQVATARVERHPAGVA